MCECARQATDQDFKDIYGPEATSHTVFALAKSRDFAKYEDAVRKQAGEANFRALKDLNAFLRTNRLTDIGGTNNWGVAVRNGEKVLVVIDYDL